MPTRRRSCCTGRSVVGTPSSRTRPDVGSMRRSMVRSNVLLPEPDGPSTVNTCPGSTTRLTSSTMRRDAPAPPGARYETPSKAILGRPPAGTGPSRVSDDVRSEAPRSTSDSLPCPVYTPAQRAISSGVEHLPYKQGVAGSNPASPTIPPDGLSCAARNERPARSPRVATCQDGVGPPSDARRDVRSAPHRCIGRRAVR